MEDQRLYESIGFTPEDLMDIIKFPSSVCELKMSRHAIYRKKVNGKWIMVLAKETKENKLEIIDWDYEQGIVYPSNGQ
jgi:hypothetical protein